jgi:hypothetical protein
MTAEMLRQLINDRRGERESEARMERLALEIRRTQPPRAERRIDFLVLGYLVSVRRQATQ